MIINKCKLTINPNKLFRAYKRFQNDYNDELYTNALNIYENNIDLIGNVLNVLAIKCCIHQFENK